MKTKIVFKWSGMSPVAESRGPSWTDDAYDHPYLLVVPRRHDPRQRSLFEHVGPWAVRAVPRNTPFYDQLAERGLLHIQLWHATLPGSFLTPHSSNGGEFELWTPGLQCSGDCYCTVAQPLLDAGIPVPTAQIVYELQAVLVYSAYIGRLSAPA